MKALGILGIDPGIEKTGYGMISVDPRCGAIRLREAGILRTRKKDSLPKRLLTLFSECKKLIKELSPQVLSIEDLYTNYRFPRTATIMGHARGVILLAACEEGVEVVTYTPARIKKSLTGYGRASKKQMALMVANQLGIDEVFPYYDISDALAAALCHANVALKREHRRS